MQRMPNHLNVWWQELRALQLPPDHHNLLREIMLHLEALEETSSTASPRITASPTTASPSAALAMEPTDRPLLRLSLWGHLDMRPGLAGLGCSYAPGWDALSASEKTVALDAAILSLTSQKRAIESSAASLQAVESPSSESSKCEHDFVRLAGRWDLRPTCSRCGIEQP